MLPQQFILIRFIDILVSIVSIMHSVLTFSPFKIEDWPEYLSRFDDPELAGQLGPMKENDPRLHQVLHADPNENLDYSIFQGEQMVAEIGV